VTLKGTVESFDLAASHAGAVHTRVLLPACYHDEPLRRFPVVYLLHGRTDSAADWEEKAFPALDAAMAEDALAPMIAVAVDGRWSERSSWWIDSAFTGDGAHEPGSAVGTALVEDLVPAVDAAFRTRAERGARYLAGYSMGGSGTVHHLLRRPDLFGAGVALSPALHATVPPGYANAREFGPFGRGAQPFDIDRHAELGYPAALARFDAARPVHLLIMVGDLEYMAPDEAEAEMDLTFEAARLHNRARRVAGVHAELRVWGGGHNWTFWRPALLAGLTRIAPPRLLE
jgi:enterochelin esterase-like enzyme